MKNFICFKGQIINQDGTPLSDVFINASPARARWGVGSRGVPTGADGSFTLKVPKRKKYKLTAHLDNRHSTLKIGEQRIFGEDTDFGQVSLS